MDFVSQMLRSSPMEGLKPSSQVFVKDLDLLDGSAMVLGLAPPCEGETLRCVPRRVSDAFVVLLELLNMHGCVSYVLLCCSRLTALL